jgi:hypothetical protein
MPTQLVVPSVSRADVLHGAGATFRVVTPSSAETERPVVFGFTPESTAAFGTGRDGAPCTGDIGPFDGTAFPPFSVPFSLEVPT